MPILQKTMDRRTFLRYSAAACSAACFGWDQSFAAAKQEADLVLRNGKILTANARDQIAQAVAVKGDKILKVGTDKQINSLIGANTNVIDLEGKTVTPGLVDSHVHVLAYGRVGWEGFLNIRYPTIKSLDDLLKAVGDKAATTPEGQWISGNQGFPGQGIDFDRWTIDQVAPNHPVYLRHASGQFSVVNSMALQLAGIDKNTPDPLNGRIVRDPATGEPTGVLMHYPAENLVMTIADGYANLSDEDLENDIKRAQDGLLSAGITSGQDVIVGELRSIQIYKNLADRGELKMRMYLLLYIDSAEKAQEYVQEIDGYKSDYLTFAGWKLAIDGGAAARTALMYNQNLDVTKYSYYYFEPEVLKRIVLLLHNTGLQIAFHIVGDKGIDEALDAIEVAMKANRRRDPRHRIEHAIWVNPKSFARIKKLGMVVSTQPQWISWFADGYRDITDDATMANYMRIGTMLKKKIPLAFGCDVPASITHLPGWAFYGATTRETLETGYIPGPQECIDIHQALRIHTMGSAYAAFEEKLKGSIEAKKLADMVVWSHDLYSATPEELTQLEALMTIVGGEIVYEKE